MRVKRSVTFMFSLAPRNAFLPLKFVVSTTSVSPSQRPREMPTHCRTGWRLRAIIERDDAHVVNHLGEDHHVARRLDDLIVGVVAGVHAAGVRPRP